MEVMKTDDRNLAREAELLGALITIAKELGWHIAVEKNTEYVEGVAIGTPDYLDRALKKS